ncbi:MAG: PD40 domain-containing protein [Deltaproteobacteria bacterium]|nr:PD40 domain-containing protein [Deltaproteobacteria bacterium]
MLLALGGLLSASVVHAYDPRRRWHTLQAPHFSVHYPEGAYGVASAVAKSAETAFAALVVRLDWQPATPIDIVLNEDTDAANGFAQSVPYNLVGLNAVAPEELGELSDYRDWTFELVAHELAHIVNIDTIGGLPRAINAVFGRLLAPNAAAPRFIVEGLAVYFESALGAAGRVRSPYFDMFLRAAVLDGSLFDLDEVTGAPLRWPQGTAAYLYGGRFMDFLARRYGEDLLAEIGRDYGRRLFPFAVNASLKQATGSDYPSLYREFVAETTARYRAQLHEVEAAGVIEGEALTARGQDFGAIRVGPRGAVYFVEAPIDAHPSLRALDPDGAEREIAWVHGAASFALYPSGDKALVAELEVDEVYRLYGDLFELDLQHGELQQLTHGARAQSVDLSKDGGRVVYSELSSMHSIVRIARADDLGGAETLVDLGPDTQVFSPRFSPAGDAVVFAASAAGQRDLYLADLASATTVKVTDDRAVDGGPVFSSDGRFVLFHSDRDGIFNLYAVPRAGGPVRRLTRVRTGAFYPEPSADGRTLYYRTYSSRGFDLARLDDVALDQAAPAESALARAPAPESPGVAAYPATPYRALPSLLPTVWTPVLATDTRGNTYGLSTSGADAVGLHAYSAAAWWGTASELAGFQLAYANRQFHPGVNVSGDRGLSYAAMPYVRNGQSQAVEEEVWSGRLSTSWPLWSRRDLSLSIGTGYELQYRRNTRPLVFDPFDRAPVFPDDGRFAATRLSLGFSNVHRYGNSISPVQGGAVSLGLRLEDPYVGSSYSAVSGTVEITHYFENPWLSRQVLATDVFFGYGRSSYLRRKLFAVGGLPQRDILLDLYNNSFGGAQALRGFPARPQIGDAALVGHVEYRAPIVDVETGVETLPIYLQTLHGSLFVDAAALADTPAAFADAARASIGFELVMGMLLGYGLPVDVRLGYGRAVRNGTSANLYLVLGDSF